MYEYKPELDLSGSGFVFLVQLFNIGAGLYGEGQMWFDGLVFEEVGLDVPLTRSEYREAPQNLSFEQVETKS